MNKNIFGQVLFIGVLFFISSCNKEEPVVVPLIENQILSIAENSPIGTIVGIVDASSNNTNETLVYGIIDGNNDKSFQINESSGQISVLSSEFLDFESTPSFEIQVEVMSSLNPNLKNAAKVTIQLQDVIAPPLDNLIAYYPFNGNANDVGVNAIHGTPYGNVVLADDRSGIPNSAYQFDGSSGFISLGVPQLLNIAQYTDYSLSFWIKPSETGFIGERVIVSLYSSPSQRVYIVNVSTNSGDKINYKMYNQGTRTHENVQAGFNLNWQHVVIVATGSTVELYVNEQKLDEQIISVNMLTGVLGTGIYIGAVHKSNTLPDLFFKGLIDDVAFYNRALTEEEINILFNE